MIGGFELMAFITGMLVGYLIGDSKSKKREVSEP